MSNFRHDNKIFTNDHSARQKLTKKFSPENLRIITVFYDNSFDIFKPFTTPESFEIFLPKHRKRPF